jgi:hypothetical protein
VESTCSFKQGGAWKPTVLGAQLLTARYLGVESPPREIGNVDKVHAPSLATIQLVYGTTTEVACGESVHVGELAACTATVRAPEPEPHPTDGRGITAPTGQVRFSTNSTKGTFSAPGCELNPIGPDASSCSVPYRPQAEGTDVISAFYDQDPTHDPSFDTTDLAVLMARSG